MIKKYLIQILYIVKVSISDGFCFRVWNFILYCPLGSDFCDRGWRENQSVVADHWISRGKVSGQGISASKGHPAESKGKQFQWKSKCMSSVFETFICLNSILVIVWIPALLEYLDMEHGRKFNEKRRIEMSIRWYTKSQIHSQKFQIIYWKTRHRVCVVVWGSKFVSRESSLSWVAFFMLNPYWFLNKTNQILFSASVCQQT